MRFEISFLREKLKPVATTFNTLVNLLKVRVIPHQTLFLYVASQNQIRILINRQEAPIILVLMESVFTDVKSFSKSGEIDEKIPVTIGFIIKNGLSLIQLFSQSSKIDLQTVLSDDEKKIKFRLSKQKQFRYLQIKLHHKTIRLQIQKPKRNQIELFSYPWIDGVRKYTTYFQLNTVHFLQLLNPVFRCKTTYPFQYLPQKYIQVEICLGKNTFCAQVKTITSEIRSRSIITGNQNMEQARQQQMINDNPNQIVDIIDDQNKEVQLKRQDGLYDQSQILKYQISFDDCEPLISMFKGEASFIIDEKQRLVLNDSEEGVYQCQILLADWIQFVGRKRGNQIDYLKFEDNQDNYVNNLMDGINEMNEMNEMAEEKQVVHHEKIENIKKNKVEEM